jgi:UDP-2-acetamido-3-amino-2,3-dideoxy-glucuronate N-acetyltransferase
VSRPGAATTGHADRSGTRIGPGAFVSSGARLGPDVEVGPNAVILAHDDAGAEPTIIEHAASIGANATVLPGVSVGFEARVRPGSVVTRSVPPRAIVEGNPALIVGYVDAEHERPGPRPAPSLPEGPRATRVRGVTLHELRTATDLRGSLAAAEVGREIPFQPARCFVVFGVPSAETRGQHAHRRCHQLLVAVSGSVRAVADDGSEREEFLLDRPTLGLYLPAMTWGVQYGYSADARLMVLASEPYDPADYIRDYATFLSLVQAQRQAP